MVSALVEHATSKVSLSLALTMSPFDVIKFLELVLSNTMDLIFLFALMKTFWNKHMPSKWPQIIPHMNGLLNNMASKGILS